MIYLLTAIGLSSGGRSIVHIDTQTIHTRRTIQNKQYIEQHNNRCHLPNVTQYMNNKYIQLFK